MYILNESKRDNFLLPYIEMLKSKGIEMNLGQLKTYLLKKFTEEAGIRNLSLGSNFYLAGVTRYYFNGDITVNKDLGIITGTEDTFIPEICQRLNALILILRNGIIDSLGQTFEQPEDIGTLPIAKLLRKYNAKINNELGINPKQKSQVNLPSNGGTVGNGYTFDILYSYKDATKYYNATNPGAWCITYGEQHYNMYTHRFKGHFVIFRKDGWENVPRQKGEGWTKMKPQDEYGCSLIAYLQNNNSPEASLITSRWNHGSGQDQSFCEADHAFTQQEFMTKTGITEKELKEILDLWKETKRNRANKSDEKKEQLAVLRDIKYRQMRINGGEALDKVFDKKAGSLPLTDRLAKRNITIWGVRIRGELYVVIVDKRKILFESLIPYNNFSMRDYFLCDGDSSQYNYYPFISNAIVIRTPDNFFYIYDLKRHDYVRVENTIKFKNIDKTDYIENTNPADSFYEIRMTSSQRALIDGKTNKPIVLPNGHSWFEKYFIDKFIITNEKKPLQVKKNGVIVFVYDFPRNELYFFDANSQRFFDMPGFLGKSNITYFTIGDFQYNGNSYNIISYDTNTYRKKTRIVSNGRPVSISGKMDFFNVKKSHADNRLLFITDEKSLYKSCYNLEEESYLFVNGEVFEYNAIGENYGGADIIIFSQKYGNYIYEYVILDLVTKKLVINPLTETPIFKSRRLTPCERYIDGLRIYTEKGNQFSDDTIYRQEELVYRLQDLKRNEVTAFKRNSAPLLIGENGKNKERNHNQSMEPEVRQINENDIKEIIRNTLKEALGENKIKELIAYHGTLNKFDKFNWEANELSGEGTARYGNGIYLTNVQDTGKHYAATAVGKKYGKNVVDVYKKIMNVISWIERFIKSKKRLRGQEDINVTNFEYWKELFISTLMGTWEKHPEFFGNTTPYNFPVGKKIGRKILNDLNNLHSWEDFTRYYQDVREKCVHDYTRYLLTVDIPDKGYIRWDDTNQNLINEMTKIISTALNGKINGEPIPKFRGFKNFGAMFDKFKSLGVDSHVLTDIVKNSNILGNYPVVGFIVPTGYGRGGDGRGLNYVIFDNKNVKILKRTALKTGETEELN